MKPLWQKSLLDFIVRDAIVLGLLAFVGFLYPKAHWYTFAGAFVAIGLPQIILMTIVFGTTAKQYPEHLDAKGWVKFSALIHAVPLFVTVMGIFFATKWGLKAVVQSGGIVP